MMLEPECDIGAKHEVKMLPAKAPYDYAIMSVNIIYGRRGLYG